jgi:hypothetical protein
VTSSPSRPSSHGSSNLAKSYFSASLPPSFLARQRTTPFPAPASVNSFEPAVLADVTYVIGCIDLNMEPIGVIEFERFF